MSFFERFKQKIKNEESKSEQVPLPSELAREKFPEGMFGDLDRAKKAASIDSLYFWQIAPEALKDIMRKSGGTEGYYLEQKLAALLTFAREKGWRDFTDVNIEEYDQRLRDARAKGELDKVEDEENPLLRHYQDQE